MIDITELKEVERKYRTLSEGLEQKIAERTKKLEESERKSKELLEALPIGIILSSPEGKSLECNSQAYKILGYKSKNQFLKVHVLDHYHDPNDRKRFIRLHDRGIVKDFEVQLKREDGSVFWASINSKTQDLENSIIYVNSFRDITARKVVEQELKESEEKWRALSENSPAHVLLLDREHKIIFINRTVPDLSKEEVIGNSIYDYTPQEFHKVSRDIYNSVWETGEPSSFHPYYKTKEGDIRYFDMWIGPIFQSGKVVALVSHSLDITERKNKEEEIRLRSEIMTNMSEGVYLIRLEDLIIVYANPRFEEMFGYDSGEMIGKYVAIVNAPTNKTPEETLCEIVGILKKIGDWHGEILNIKKDGTPFWCYANVSLFDHPEYGKVIVSVHTDITERKKREEEIFDLAQFPSENPYPVLRVNRDHLMYINEVGRRLLKIIDYNNIPNIFQEGVRKTFESNQFTELEIELNGKIYSFILNPVEEKDYINIYGMDITERKHVEDKLKELNRLKSEFFRRASHELKTPLISIKGFSDLILSLHADQLDTIIVSRLEEINDGCERLQNLINNLLKSSRLESTGLKPKLKMEDLSFLIKFCVHELESLVVSRNQSIRLDIPHELFVKIEKEEIHDVLSNLLTNAIKYTPPKGKIEIKTELKDDSVVVSVKDNGIGFTEEQKTKIFHQFGKIERYGQGLDLGIDGTGLGLYISKRIVELHGGKIWMDSEGKNKGASFYFSLPTAK